jgi:hypothetical protein
MTLYAGSSSCDEDIYSQIVIVEGKITSKEIVTGEVLTSSQQFLVFRRTDCKKCLITTRADSEGKYVVYLRTGKYEVIVGDCGIKRDKDCISPAQNPIVNASDKVGRTIFDINLVHDKNDFLDITGPR